MRDLGHLRLIKRYLENPTENFSALQEGPWMAVVHSMPRIGLCLARRFRRSVGGLFFGTRLPADQGRRLCLRSCPQSPGNRR